MRLLAIALLVACGAPQAQSQPYTPEPERPSDWWVKREPVDAGVADAETDVAVDAAVAVVADDRQEQDVELGRYVLENGVKVFKSDRQFWCATGGKRKGLCAATPSSCKKALGGACKATNAVACFKATMRMTGEVIPLCADNYGFCDETSDAMVQDPEISSLSECVIFRYEAGAK